MSEQDYYKILGLRFDSSPEEIRIAYRKLARTHHPDVATSDSDRDIFQKVTEAYSTLADLTKRNAYNKAHGYPFVEFLDDEPPKQSEEPLEKGEKAAPGKLTSTFSSSKEIWKKLREGRDGVDQRVSDKVAQIDPSEFKPDPEDPPVSAWGEHDDQNSRAPQSGKSVFGWLRRGKSDRNIEELKKFQDAKLRANNIAPVDEQSWAPDQSRKYQPQEEEKVKGAATVEERVFQFRITSYEASLGTRRQIAFPDKTGDGFTRLNVKIPVGTKDGTKLQISRGWDRITVRVEVIEDRFYRISKNDIWVFPPLLFHEAFFGIEISLLAPDSSVLCQLAAADRFLLQQQMGERGLPKQEGGRGDVFVQPYVVPSNCPEEIALELSSLGEAEVARNAESGRSQKLPSCGETSVVVVTVSPKELFLGAKIAFGEDKAESFEIPKNWKGGLLRSSKGREVAPFLLLPPNQAETLKALAERLKALSLPCERSEMVL